MNAGASTSKSILRERGDQKDKIDQKESLKEMIARKKKEKKESPLQLMPDPYQTAAASQYITRGKTVFCYDQNQAKHTCEWDKHYPESPDRANCIMDRLISVDILSHCENIHNYLRSDLYDRILSVHDRSHYEKLKEICRGGNTIIMEHESALHDAIYINQHTFDVACRAVSATLNVVLPVARGEVQNGMAIVRPPGHHALRNDYNGYCFFNNVAIAAEACIQDKLAKRILIVDVDVHHGQGTQQIFYDRSDVLYFSIHRYEHGTFWPNLPESNFYYIGKGDGIGYNINVPLNATGLADDDYLAIVCSILLPVAYEYNPDLIIISAGYDAVLGCPEGRMNVTPGFYSHLITLLSGLAKGNIAVILEGGYFLPSLAEGVSMTLKALIGGPCPILDPAKHIDPTVVETICNVRRMLVNKWNCFKHCQTIPLSETTGDVEEHRFIIDYLGEQDPGPYLTRNCYPLLSAKEYQYYQKLTETLREKYGDPIDLPVCYAYHKTMLLHTPSEEELERPERPERLTTIIDRFEEFKLNKRLMNVEVTPHDFSMYSPHKNEYLLSFFESNTHSQDLYFNEHTYDAVMVAVSALLSVVDAVMNEKARSGLAIIRPPGHHAEQAAAMGFCFLNNIAIAAKYIRAKYNVNRILIVDFDVHHGNGTQNIFYSTDEVMYISIHRDENGKYFPVGSSRNYFNDGHGVGQGFNINIPFNKDKMGDTEYIAAFHNIILPAAYAYAPQVVLVSAGFDAGINDPLGGYLVHPETFGHFIQMLKPLAGGKLILALEGGYNLITTSYAMAICAKTLLGDPVMTLNGVYKTFSSEACKTIRNVGEHLKRYHNIFRINKKLALTPYVRKKVESFTPEDYNFPLLKALDVEHIEDSDYVTRQVLEFNTVSYN